MPTPWTFWQSMPFGLISTYSDESFRVEWRPQAHRRLALKPSKCCSDSPILPWQVLHAGIHPQRLMCVQLNGLDHADIMCGSYIAHNDPTDPLHPAASAG